MLARDIAADFSPRTSRSRETAGRRERAEEYADYVIERHREGRAHITPPVVMRASEGQVTEVREAGSRRRRRASRAGAGDRSPALLTADGQHRIYGARKKLEWYEREISKQKLLLETAEENGQEPRGHQAAHNVWNGCARSATRSTTCR